MLVNPLKILIAAGAITALIGCAGKTPSIQSGPGAEKDANNLYKVDNTRVDLVYADPNANLRDYTHFIIDPLDVSQVVIVEPFYIGLHRRTWTLTEKDKALLQDAYQTSMEKHLAKDQGFGLASQAAPNAIRIRAAIIEIAPNAPKDDFASRPIGRMKIISEGAGSITMAALLEDSVSQKPIAKVIDNREGSTMWGLNNRVSNTAEVRRVFSRWAQLLRSRFDTIHQRN